MQQNGSICERSCQFRHNGLPGFNGLIKLIQPSRFLFVCWTAVAIRGVFVQLSFSRAVWITTRTHETYTINAADMPTQCYGCSESNTRSTFFGTTGGTRAIILDEPTLTRPQKYSHQQEQYSGHQVKDPQTWGQVVTCYNKL